MFEELDDNSGWAPKSMEPQAPKPPPVTQQPPQEQRQNTYQNQQPSSGYQPRPNYQQNGGQGGGGGGGYQGNNNFKRKEDVVQDAYLPIGIFVDAEFTEEARTSLYNIASKLIAKKYTVRVFGGDKAFCERVKALSSQFVEVYVPWKMFNEIDSKFYFNSLTAKELGRQHFTGWDKIPDSVKAILCAQVRLLFGEKNNSIVMCLITWTKDQASRGGEVTKDTGRAGFIIKMASSYGFPVLNIAKQSSGPIIERTFGI
jgi:hypothetical protein